MRHLLATSIAIILLGVPWIAENYPDQIRDMAGIFSETASRLAAVIMHNTKTVASLQSKYNTTASQGSPKVRILLVPGHEPDYGGAEYGDVKERNLTVEFANNLEQILANNGKYEIFVTRSNTAWSPEFSLYFNNPDSWSSILDWTKTYQREYANLVTVNSSGKPRVYHNTAPKNIAYRLYGITKWANEHDIDIVLHIHLNDYPRQSATTQGKYSGFTIYVPEKQYLNSTTTQAIARTIFDRLKKYNPVSDLAGESAGITFEPDLIAIGANNTADSASMLIEYGYIYESQFTNSNLRDLALKDLAYQTYLGLQDFFDPSGVANRASSYDTLALPHEWRMPLNASSASSQDIFALQTAFIHNGVYPPAGKDMNDCPRTGTFGGCTKSSLDNFQKKYGISGEDSIVGPETSNVLNRVFGTKKIN